MNMKHLPMMPLAETKKMEVKVKEANLGCLFQKFPSIFLSVS
jgi:hypothetical protein